jgi:nanoRNase/pAp phosphatase (c-di-AMP/oligoRNAs hydrolase)
MGDSAAGTKLGDLIIHLDPERPVMVQAHDFPDHDAVATGYSLAELLRAKDFDVTLCYGGSIHSESLRDAIAALDITISSVSEVDWHGQIPQLVVVDGFTGNGNIRGVEADLVGVIDHHVPPRAAECPFADIRSDYGACSTILFEYYREEGLEPTGVVATALLLGVMMDTAFMTRAVSPVDLQAFTSLFRNGDWETAARLLRNSLSLSDLAAFRQAIEACLVARDFAYIALPGEFTPEVMALIADFFLGLREIHFVVVVSGDRDEYRISVRSEDHQRPCDVVIQHALAGIGAGGGHMHMGGGSIPRGLYPGDEGLRKRFLDTIEQSQEQKRE